MKRSLPFRKDLDDGDPPGWVNERVKKIPRCCRCGNEIQGARCLWTLCEGCVHEELGISQAHVSTHPTRADGLITDLAAKMVASLTSRDANEKRVPAAVLWHHEQFLKRGLDHRAARRLAQSLAVDPVHRAGCERCRGDLVAIERELIAKQVELEHLANVGGGYLSKRSAVPSNHSRVA